MFGRIRGEQLYITNSPEEMGKWNEDPLRRVVGAMCAVPCGWTTVSGSHRRVGVVLTG